MRKLVLGLVVLGMIGCGDDKSKGGNKAPATDANQQGVQQQNATANATSASQQELERLRAENLRLQQQITQLQQQQAQVATGQSGGLGTATSGAGGGLSGLTGLLGAIPGLQGCVQSLLQSGGGNIDLQNLGSGCSGIFNIVAGGTTTR